MEDRHGEAGVFFCAGNLLRVQEITVGCIQPSASIYKACTAVRAGYLFSLYRLVSEIGTLACDKSHFRKSIGKNRLWRSDFILVDN